MLLSALEMMMVANRGLTHQTFTEDSRLLASTAQG